MFRSYRVDIWHPSKLPIYGDFFLKNYTVFKIAVVYDKIIPNLCLVYAKIFMFFNQLYHSSYRDLLVDTLIEQEDLSNNPFVYLDMPGMYIVYRVCSGYSNRLNQG